MNRMTSAAFRVMIMDLEQAVEVTVHGQVIGTWTPIKGAAKPVMDEAPREGVKAPVSAAMNVSRTFTPVPKPATRR